MLRTFSEDQIGTTNYRIFIYPVNSVTSPGTLCDDSNGANGPEYQVMIRTGNLPIEIHIYLPHEPTRTYLPNYLTTYLLTYLPTYLHAASYIHVPTFLTTYLPTYLSTYLPAPTYLFVQRFVCHIVSKISLSFWYCILF